MKILKNTLVKDCFEIGDLYKVKRGQSLLYQDSTVKIVDIKEGIISYIYVKGHQSPTIYKRPSWEFGGCVILEPKDR